jgi:hypothetical protein
VILTEPNNPLDPIAGPHAHFDYGCLWASVANYLKGIIYELVNVEYPISDEGLAALRCFIIRQKARQTQRTQ